MALSGCGGSGGPAPLVLTQLNPPPEATGVSTTAVVEASFGESLEMSSVGDLAFTLRSSAGQVPASLSLPVTPAGIGSVLRLTPAQPLAKLTRYELALANTITGVSGARFAGLTTSFTTQDGAWQAQQTLSGLNTNALEPRLAITEAGRGVATWTQQTTTTTAWASLYDGASWLPSIQLSGSAVAIRGLSAGMDSAGNALTVWAAPPGVGATSMTLWTSAYAAQTGRWGRPLSIATVPVAPDNFQIECAFDREGNALLAWSQPEGTGTALWAMRYRAASSNWTPAMKVGEGGDLYNRIQVTLSSSGDAHLMWVALNASPGIPSIRVRDFSASTDQWGDTTVLGPSSAGLSGSQIVTDPRGNVLVLWSVTVNDESMLWTSRYDMRSRQWQAATQVPSGAAADTRADAVQMAIDPAGNVLAVRAQYRANGNRVELWANRYDAATLSWGEARQLATGGPGFSLLLALGVDKAGNGLALWTEGGGTVELPQASVRSVRFRAGSGEWDSPVLVAAMSGNPLSPPQVAVDQGGSILAVWNIGGPAPSVGQVVASAFK
ncbi:MAG: Ig-like domain-containing protein [Ramlibacter sp.]|nr:Ig-like domain-containing protein [Ramlibacter sp.]